MRFLIGGFGSRVSFCASWVLVFRFCFGFWAIGVASSLGRLRYWSLEFGLIFVEPWG